ncbi:hypothetical protein BH09BAC1_BH09BAC1_03830 [soil metagenome]
MQDLLSMTCYKIGTAPYSGEPFSILGKIRGLFLLYIKV